MKQREFCRGDFVNTKVVLKMGSVVSFIFSAAVLSGCAVVDSSEVSPASVHADYSATYFEQTNGTSYKTHFTVGGDTGTVVELDGDSTVEIDGNGMTDQHDLLNDVNYVRKASSSYQDYLSSHEFYFRDQSGTVFRNDFTFPVMMEVAVLSTTDPTLQSGFTVNWVASGPMESPMDSGDMLEAVLERPDGTLSKSTSNPWGAASGAIQFSTEELQILGSTIAQLSICHHHTTSAINGDASGGDLEVVACSRAVNLTIQ
jgi:hypothetical protein